MLAQLSSVDENAIAQKAQTRGQKGPLGAKSLTSSNLPKTPSASSSNTSKRRVLGDISNRKVQQDDTKTVDTRTEKKSSKLGTNVKATHTPSSKSKGLQDAKTNDDVHRKTVNFTDQPSVISVKSNKIDKFESSKSVQKNDDFDDGIEKPNGRMW
jgi:hypothetical protein